MDRSTKHLQLVRATVDPDSPNDNSSKQLTLFSRPAGSHLVLADTTNLFEEDFHTLMDVLQPHVVVDLRVMPRFDFGRLNRRRAFAIFEQCKSRYHDFTHSLGVQTDLDSALNPAILADPLSELLSKSSPKPRIVLLLLDDSDRLSLSLRVLPDALKPQPEGGWEVEVFGGGKWLSGSAQKMRG